MWPSWKMWNVLFSRNVFLPEVSPPCVCKEIAPVIAATEKEPRPDQESQTDPTTQTCSEKQEECDAN